jgi:small subunit ribosomal protein S21
MTFRNNDERLFTMSQHFKGSLFGKRGITVETANNGQDGEYLIRLFMKKVKQEGLIRELREREYYERPGVIKRRKKLEARRRHLKDKAKAKETTS